jgi:hypothetical protein
VTPAALVALLKYVKRRPSSSDALTTLTHPALRAGSTLSRIAEEGAERSEAGEGEAA